MVSFTKLALVALPLVAAAPATQPHIEARDIPIESVFKVGEGDVIFGPSGCFKDGHFLPQADCPQKESKREVTDVVEERTLFLGYALAGAWARIFGGRPYYWNGYVYDCDGRWWWGNDGYHWGRPWFYGGYNSWWW